MQMSRRKKYFCNVSMIENGKCNEYDTVQNHTLVWFQDSETIWIFLSTSKKITIEMLLY